MSEISHSDAAQLTDDGFHEIQLSGKQLVFLLMATTIVAVAIFLLGVQVGRNVRTEQMAGAEPVDTVASAALPPPAAASTPPSATASSGPPADEPPAPAQEPDDELSYAKRLQASTPGASGSPGAPGAHDKAKLQPEPAPVTPASAKPGPATAQPGPATAAAAPAASGHPGAWIVQVTALQDRAAASAIARRLADKGYPAFVLDPAAGAPVIYRVQVGGYPDRDKADQAARQLEKEERFKAYVRSR